VFGSGQKWGMTQNETLVFVYGTLRTGGVRAMRTIAPSCRIVGDAVIRGQLFDLGAFPGLLVDPNGGSVCGELFGVDDATLARLDQIEQYFPDRPEESYYVRIPVTVAFGSTVTDCETYEIRPEFFGELTPIESGDWITHFSLKTDIPEERWPDGKRIEK
jgi:gamma-glutamylcyclotransferase (GGCT)/AIG2-like uncharacterized protein YtfP